MIDTRQELLIALADAAELEQNLACLYLFAAFTIKTETSDGITDPQATALKGMKRTIVEVALQEMGHLGTVCNLLTAVGGLPHFRRANFPQPPRFYPPEIPFVLERFGPAALARFIEFERPDAPSPAELAGPDPLEYTRVGDLYRQIKAAFVADTAGTLFVNADAPQDETNWSPRVEVFPVKTRAEALAALDAIIVQGEGTPDGGDDSHYGRFKKIVVDLEALMTQDPTLDPARPVAANPQTRKPRDAAVGALITDAGTLEVAELFNVCYGLMLRVLSQYYAFAGETPAQRTLLRQVAVRLMQRAVRNLGVVLTRLPLGQPGVNAGPGFEIYGEEALSTRPRVAWDVIIERLGIHAAQATQLAGQVVAIATELTSLSTDLTAIRTLLLSDKPT